MCMGANVAVLAGRPYVEETSEGTRQPIAEALARRRARRDPDSPLVFHREGIPIRRWRTAWRTACQATGVPTRFLHDCRRTAARNLIRASVPERVAMLLTGHKSRAIFDRYNIIHEQELLEAGDQLVKYLAQQAQATPRGLNPGFSQRIGNSRRTGAAVCCAAIARSNVGVSAFANIVATVREWFSSLAHLRRKVPPAVLFCSGLETT